MSANRESEREDKQRFPSGSSGEDSVSFLDNLFRRNQKNSARVARERLLTVLVHDRVKLTPEVMEQLKQELSAVIARYVPTVNPNEIEVTLLHGESIDRLKADIPLRRSKEIS
jgi:cell division topological specificity factor